VKFPATISQKELEMKRLFAILAALACLLSPAGVAYADSAPHANMTVGTAKPASTTFEGSPTSGMYKWIDCSKGDCTNLTIINTAIYTSRDGVLDDICPTTYKTCKGVIPSGLKMTDVDIYQNACSTGSNLPEGVSFLNGHDAVLDNVRVHNFCMVAISGHYNNGDCYDGERPFYNITFRNTLADHCADGGYDFKSTNVVFDNATAQYVDICFRAWGQATGTASCSNWGPTSSGAAIQVTKLPDSTPGGGTKGDMHFTLFHPSATPGVTQKFANLHYTGASLVIDRCWGLMPANDGKNKLVTYEDGATAANTILKLGPGCALGDNDNDPAAVVTPAPPVVAAPISFCSTKLVPNGNGDATIDVKTPSWLKVLGVTKETILDAKYTTTTNPTCPFLYDLHVPPVKAAA
jgi:hypothetical protein